MRQGTATPEELVDSAYQDPTLDLGLRQIAQSFALVGSVKIRIKGRQKSITLEKQSKQSGRKQIMPPKPDEIELLLNQIRTLTTKLTYLGEKMQKDQLIELVPSDWKKNTETEDTAH